MRTVAASQARTSTSVVAFLTALAMVVALGVQPAEAEDQVDPGVGSLEGFEVTPEEYETLFDDLTRSNLSRSTQVVAGVRHVTFTVPLPDANEFGDEFEFTMAAPHPVRGPGGSSEGELSPQGVGGGVDLTGMYVSFGPTSQGMIAAGAGAALAVAICGLSVVGAVACAIWSGIIAAAFSYLIANGFCPGSQRLRVYITGWNRVTCV